MTVKSHCADLPRKIVITYNPSGPDEIIVRGDTTYIRLVDKELFRLAYLACRVTPAQRRATWDWMVSNWGDLT